MVSLGGSCWIRLTDEGSATRTRDSRLRQPRHGWSRSFKGRQPSRHDAQGSLEAGRGAWAFKADQVLEQNEVQIVDLEGTVLAVAKINSIVKAGDRYAIEGDPLPNDPRIGKPTTTPRRSHNVGYFCGHPFCGFPLATEQYARGGS